MCATINEFLFPIFLFVVYFCGVSLLIYNPEKPSTYQQESPDSFPASNLMDDDEDRSPTEPLTPESKSEEIPPTEEEVSIPSEPTTPEVDEDDFPDSEVENNLYIQTEAIINNLSKRQSRKICQPLGIQQKSGRTEKTLNAIKTEIGNLFLDNPKKVIAVIQEQLPELLGLPTIIAS